MIRLLDFIHRLESVVDNCNNLLFIKSQLFFIFKSKNFQGQVDTAEDKILLMWVFIAF